MKEPAEIGAIKQELAKSLGRALEMLENFFAIYPEIAMRMQLDEISTDYGRMVDYWKNGYKDDNRQQYYDRLVADTLRLLTNAGQRYAITHDSRLQYDYSHVRNSGRDWSVENIRKELEHHVSEMAMVELLPENKRKEKCMELYALQHATHIEMFDYIRTSEQWNESTAEAMEAIFISPTIDTITQQTLLAAVILNNICWFDYQKERVLMNVYMKSADEFVRQRALVGWVLCMNSAEYVMADAEHEDIVGRMLADERCVEELRELQIQMVYCMNAEKDRDEIHKNIMPDIIKNSPVKIKGGVITEAEEDSLEDIIDPEASERRMEELEANMRKMTDMQRQGHDIFYGGFSQMKRFPFFNRIMHWVMPFYRHHPEITRLFINEDEISMINKLMRFTPFCDSDRYSFMLAFRQVMASLPKNMLDAMKEGQMQLLGSDYENTPQQDKPALVRRSFLQSLYRFFRVCPSRDMFRNPFERDGGQVDFFSQQVFADTPLQQGFPSMAMFFLKHNMVDEAKRLMKNYHAPEADYSACMVLAKLYPEQEEQYYRQALECKPDDDKALRGLGRACFARGRYDEAFSIYDSLAGKYPDNSKLLLSKVAVMANIAEKREEAKDILYRLEYEQPDNVSISRMLAKVLMSLGKVEQAQAIYERLGKGDESTDDDKMNLGICLFASHRFEDAAAMLSGFDTAAIDAAIKEDGEMLASKGITPLDIELFHGLL